MFLLSFATSCPVEDCGIKTNIWDRLRLIQRLKKDFAAAKVGRGGGGAYPEKDVVAVKGTALKDFKPVGFIHR
jgi:hypothetical protein